MSKAPTHTIFAVIKPEGAAEDAPGDWTPVGVAWTHSGGGFGIAFDSKRTSDGPEGTQLIDLPKGCRLVARIRKAKPEGGQ